MKKFIIITVVIVVCIVLFVEFFSVINNSPKECSNPKNGKAVLVYYRDSGKSLTYKFENPETKNFFDISFFYISGLDDTRDLIKLGDTLNVRYCTDENRPIDNNEVVDYVQLEELLKTLRVEQ